MSKVPLIVVNKAPVTNLDVTNPVSTQGLLDALRQANQPLTAVEKAGTIGALAERPKPIKEFQCPALTLTAVHPLGENHEPFQI